MAKTTTTTTIDGRLYSLHTTKSSGDNAAIGSVPVLASAKIEDFIDVYPEDFVVSCVKAGMAVNLQAKARRACSSGKMTQGEFDTIASELLADDVQKYAGKFELLRADVAKKWTENSEDRAFDEKKVWTELKNGQ